MNADNIELDDNLSVYLVKDGVDMIRGTEQIRLSHSELNLILVLIQARKAELNLRRAEARVTEANVRFARKLHEHREKNQGR